MVGFPGLGIPEFNINGILFSIGSFPVHWYGLIIAVGFFCAALYVCKRAPAFGLTADNMIDMLIFAVPLSIIGARLFYVVFNWNIYKMDLLSIIRIRDGGIAIYGAVIFAVVTCVLFCRYKRISAGAMLDLGVLGLLIGQSIGRWGNFVNIEVYGTETNLPWRMTVYGIGVHPLFLYESLWNALGFLLLHLFSKKRKFNGQLTLMYIVWYGLVRGILEGMRDTDFALMLGVFRVSQLLGFASCVIALVILIYQSVFKEHDPEDLFAWVKVREDWVASRSVGAAAKIDKEDAVSEDIDLDTDAEGLEEAVFDADDALDDVETDESAGDEAESGEGEPKE